MLIIPIKDGENIDKALKRFKRKFDKTGVMRSLRDLITPVLSNLRLNLFRALSIFSPSLIGIINI